ncbi:MAG: hypothetical protein M1358_06390 [Chloroflexi bacterium]|nr:hypothetical protein [Chloroflexota bacterium]
MRVLVGADDTRILEGEEQAKAAPELPIVEQLGIFFLACGALLAAGVWMNLYFRLHEGDALSRSYAAAISLYGSSPGLAKLGLLWAPLPSALQIPLALYRPLTVAGLSGVIVSALAGALGLLMMDRILARHVPNRWIRFPLLLIYQGNLLILYYSVNGMTEGLLVTLVLVGWDQFQRLYDGLPHFNGVTNVGLMGICAGAAFLTRYEGAAFGLAMYLVLLIALVAKRRQLGIILGSSARRRLSAVDGSVVIEGYSLAYLTPFVYAIFLWLFFNWVIMGDPFNFMFGKGSNIQQASILLKSGSTLAGLKGNFPAALAYAAKSSALAFPSFYLAGTLSLVLGILKRDALAISLAILAASFPAFQALLTFVGQSFGVMRFYIYVIPFSLIGLAYAFRHLSDTTRIRAAVYQMVMVLLVAASSLVTWYSAALPDVAREGETLFVQAVMHDEPVDNFAREKEIAQHLTQLPPGKKILADDQQADYIILFTQQFERFVTTRNTEFADIVSNPVGRVDYVLIPRVDAALNLIIQRYPDVYDKGAPFLEPVQEFAGRDQPWKLYRVVSAGGSRAGRLGN